MLGKESKTLDRRSYLEALEGKTECKSQKPAFLKKDRILQQSKLSFQLLGCRVPQKEKV